MVYISELDVLINQLDVLRFVDTQQALQVALHAKKTALALNAHEKFTQALSWEATLLFEKCQLPLAFKRALEAYQYATKGKFKNIQGQALNTLGGILLQARHYGCAFQVLTHLLKFTTANPTGNSHLKTLALNNFGLIHIELGLSEQAVNYFIQAMETAPVTPFWYVAKGIVETNLGIAYTKTKQFEKGLEHAQNSIRILTKSGADKPSIIAYQRLAYHHLYRGQMEEAQSALNHAQLIMNHLHDPNLEVRQALKLGMLYYLMNQPHDALHELEGGIKIAEEHHLDFYLAKLYLLLAKTQLQIRNLEKATYYQRCFKLATHHDTLQAARYWKALSKVIFFTPQNILDSLF